VKALASVSCRDESILQFKGTDLKGFAKKSPVGIEADAESDTWTWQGTRAAAFVAFACCGASDSHQPD
jgi:hypothetical protein